MSYQPKDESGALFKNDKGDNPARPDYRGDVMVGGVVYELSAWIKPLASDASKKFMSISAKPKQAQRQEPRQEQRRQEPPPQPKRASSGFDDLDSDIPW